MHTTRAKSKETNNVVRYRNDGDFYFSLGIKAFQKKRFNRAEKWFQKAVNIAPSNPLYLCQLSVLYTEIGQYHRANDILQRVIEIHGDNYPDCFYLLANNFGHLGLFNEAKKYANKYLEIHPNGEFKNDVIQLIDLIEHVEDFDLEEDFDFEDEDELIIYQESVFYHLERREWDEAIELLEELMLIYPEFIFAKHEYAFALFQKGDQQEALTLEEAWFDEEPHSLLSRLNLIYFYYKLGNTEKFLSLLKSIDNVYPTYETQKLKIAVTLAQVGQYEEALSRFKLVNKSRVMGYLSYYLWYSKVLIETGYINEGMELRKEGIKKHPILKEFIDE